MVLDSDLGRSETLNRKEAINMDTNKSHNTEKAEEGIKVQGLEGEFEVINGVACPIDPQERLLCESCQ